MVSRTRRTLTIWYGGKTTMRKSGTGVGDYGRDKHMAGTGLTDQWLSYGFTAV